MFLAGKADNTISELDDKDIFEDLEHFESYKGSLEIQMQQFVAEFDQAYNKLTRDGITICSDHLGFKLFKTNQSHNHWGKL